MTYDSTHYSATYEPTYSTPPSRYFNGGEPEQSGEELQALRHQADRLSHLLQVMPAGVIVLDGKGIVRQANGQAMDLLGEPLEGQLWRTIIARSFKPRADDGHEVSLIDGRRVKLSITPLQTEPGQLIVLTDLTETRQLQARVSHMQRLSALGKMVASLAHQIRTPLSAAMLYAANLTRPDVEKEAGIGFAHKLTGRLQELESQVNDMLLFAKSGEEQVVSRLSLSDIKMAIVPNAVSLTDPHRQQLVFEGFDTQAQVIGNQSALSGALLNLIHNASQVSDSGARIRIVAQRDEQNVHIQVIDTGPGVPITEKDKIFEPFFTTKTHGTGLGLAVVKSVAHAHQGRLSVTNLAHGGACFCLTLPVADCATATHTSGETA